MKSLKITKWVDGVAYTNVPTDLECYFSETNALNQKRLQNVGVVLNRNSINIFLPKNTKIDSTTNDDIRLLVKVLMNYQDRQIANEDGPLVKSNDLFTTIKWLVNDYTNNGLLMHSEKRTRLQANGRINWNKTIKKVIPTYINDEPILTEFYKTKSFIEPNDLTMIHSAILQDIAENYGFLIDFKYFDKYKGVDLFQNDILSKIIATLTKKLRYINQTRSCNLIRQIIAYLTGKGMHEDLSLTTTEFHVIFEHAMKKVVHHNESLEKFVPKAKWEIKIDNRLFTPTNSQIPDALVLNSNKLDIYDAKYYNFNLKNLSNTYPPLDWYSVGKQFFYDISFNSPSPIQHSSNNFVFPAYPMTDMFQRVGTVTVKIDSQNKEINVLQINTFAALKALYK